MMVVADFSGNTADITGLLHTAWPSPSELNPAVCTPVCPKDHRQNAECP